MSEVKISKRQYEELVRAQRKLDALESAGVDNWSYYDEALSELRKEDAYEELLNQYVDSILEECSLNGDVEYPAGREAGHSILLGGSESVVNSLLRKFYIEAGNI